MDPNFEIKYKFIETLEIYIFNFVRILGQRPRQ
jgi:hypothetical protein